MAADSAFNVKGSSIRSKFDFVRDHFGAEAAQELKAEFQDHVSLFPVLDSLWYPFDVYDDVNRRIAEKHFSGDLSRLEEVGMYSAEKVLTSVYRAFAEGQSFADFLVRAATLHERFYSHGTMRVVLGEDNRSAEVHLEGAPRFSDADLHIASGFYRGAAKLLGHDGVQSTFDRDAAGAHFRLRWS